MDEQAAARIRKEAESVRALHPHHVHHLGRARAEEYGDAHTTSIIAQAAGTRERPDERRADLWCARQLERIEEATRGLKERAAVRLRLKAEIVRARHRGDVVELGHTGAEQFGDAETRRIIAEAVGVVVLH